MLLNSAPPALHYPQPQRGGSAEPYPLFVLVRLSDYCRLALVPLIFLVFIIVIIGISRWAEMPVRLNQVKRAFWRVGPRCRAGHETMPDAGKRSPSVLLSVRAIFRAGIFSRAPHGVVGVRSGVKRAIKDDAVNAVARPPFPKSGPQLPTQPPLVGGSSRSKRERSIKKAPARSRG
jgi:hypothetical protein